ncbi:MAG: divalent-cation tolerance protein CutA [Patescibacteria group bacterium]|nr:divalent-cation tolerance protein CutA [Patescibacteria group bacterium]
MKPLISIYITNPTRAVAQRIVQRLLEKRLIACGNIFPCRSWYRWQGKIAAHGEYILIAKTAAARWEKIKREVENIHPDRIPCIGKMPFAANARYAAWVRREVRMR